MSDYDPESLQVDQAIEIMHQCIRPSAQTLDIETVNIFDALDRVLAADIISPIDVPAADNSAMDGYALALRAGVELRTRARVREITHDDNGMATGVVYYDAEGVECKNMALIEDGARLNDLLVDIGDADNFLTEQLRPELLERACATAGLSLTLRRQPGYDHSYYFIQTFVEDHLKHHAAGLA